jgi:hypothetical protein
MGKSVLLIGGLIAVTPAWAFAQIVPGNTRDGTTNVQSANIGTPNQPVDAMSQYLTRQGLQDLNSRAANDAGNLGPSRPAKKDELTAGAAVNDKAGVAMAKIESVESDGIVVSIGPAKVKVPADAFGHNKAGLLLDMTKAQFEQVVAQAHPAS